MESPAATSGLTGDVASLPWRREGQRSFEFPEVDLSKFSRMRLGQGAGGFRSLGSEAEFARLGLDFEQEPAPLPDKGETPFSSKKGLPPRPPMRSTMTDTTLPSAGVLLRSDNSMVDRLEDGSKNYVDPKDAQNLLPSSLLQSESLDLKSYFEQAQAQLQAAEQVEALTQAQQALSLPQTQALALSQAQLLSAQVQPQLQISHNQLGSLGGQEDLVYALSNSAVVGGLDLTSVDLNALRATTTVAQTQQQQVLVDASRLTPLPSAQPVHRRRGMHSRSASEPVYNIVGANGVQTVPVFALLPDFSLLPAEYVEAELAQGGVKGGSWGGAPVHHVRSQSRTFDRCSPVGFERGGGSRAGMYPDDGYGDFHPRRRRNNYGRNGDMPKKENNKKKGGGNKSGGAGGAHHPSGRSTLSKSEVKKLVKYQTQLRKPIRTPWFRDKPRNPAARADDTDVQNNNSADVESPVNSPTALAPASPQRAEGPRKGTGFFCPSRPN